MPKMPKKFAIEVKGLTKTYGNLKALDSVDLLVPEGELFGLLGPNGAGKTTMIRAMTGQIKPQGGKVSVLGIDAIMQPVEVREVTGIVPEQETPPSFLSAEEYLHFVSRIRGVRDADGKIDWWFKYLDFENERDVLCKDLSRGTRQKLMIAQAFLHEPRLAFIDEPLINLDPIIQQKIKEYFSRFVKQGGTIFLSTHVLEIAEEICTRIGIIDKGRIVHVGPLSALRKKKKHLGDFFLSLVKD
jgi:ABC-2 type transport system ATP-binding protein